MRVETIGDATLICGDCEAAMAEMTENQFELAIVDPPYGLKQLSVEENRDPNSKFRRSMASMVDSAKGWNSTKPTGEYFAELFRVSNNQIVWGANNFTMPESEYFIVWDKMQSVDNFASAEYAWTNVKMPAKVFRYSIHRVMSDRKAEGGKIHPTQKPVNLYKWLLKNYAKEGDHILDTHGGSMSSVIACLDMGFKITCYEIDEDYFDAGVRRVEEHVKQLRLEF